MGVITNILKCAQKIPLVDKEVDKAPDVHGARFAPWSTTELADALDSKAGAMLGSEPVIAVLLPVAMNHPSALQDRA
jgi:hypothetical protein